MKAELNINMLIAQLRKASYELGYAEGRKDALKEYLDVRNYSSDKEERAILGIPKEEQETKDELEEALGFTD